MKQQAKRVAVCSMMAACSVVVMLLGAVLSLGMYLCPMLVGLSLMLIGREYGIRYQLMLWIVISVLCIILVPNPEENLMFAGLFGWYPALRPILERVPKSLRMLIKLLVFNTTVIALEALIIYVLVPEMLDSAMLFLLLLMGNVMFVMYDRVIPKFPDLADRFIKKRGLPFGKP